MQKKYLAGHALLLASAIIFISNRNSSAKAGTQIEDTKSLALSQSDSSRQSSSFASSTQNEVREPHDEDQEIRYWKMEPKPFEIGIQGKNFKWAAADGRKPEAVRKLASNAVEYDFLMEANQWTLDRQLVYLPDDFQQKAQDIFEGRLKELTIPAPDGEELHLQIGFVSPANEVEPTGPVTGYFEASFKDGEETIPVAIGASEGSFSIGYRRNGLEYQLETRGEFKNEVFINTIDPIKKHIAMGSPNCNRSTLLNEDNVGDIPIQPSYTTSE